MMSNQHLSVALCTYNGSPYLKEQLDSIATQTRLPDELVICDDRSQDNTIDIINAFATKADFPVHLYINKENLGSTKNFENAIRLCSGDIIALSDQDDVWHPQKLMRIEAVFLKSPNAGAVFTDGEMVDEYLRPLGYRLWQRAKFGYIRQKRLSKGSPLAMLLIGNIVTGATMAFRAEFKDLVLPIPPSWVHDAWISLLIAATADLTIIHEPLIKYRQHSRQQLGLPRQDIRKLLSWAFQRDPSFFLDRANQYRLAYERLLAIDNISYREGSISQLKAKIDHIYVRHSINVSKRKLSCLLLVLRELVTLRYSRYSDGGAKAAVVDFW